MYNKLFTKILDSSVWLEDHPTRIVWLTLLAAMDEDGYAHFAALGNLANRARVTETECARAVEILSSPDPESGNPANNGRRIEKVPGGWIVLNAGDHRDMVTRAIRQEQTRQRVRLYRDRKKADALDFDPCNAPVTPSVSGSVSETDPNQEIKTVSSAPRCDAKPTALVPTEIALMTFPTIGSGEKEWHLYPSLTANWYAAFPNLDVIAECRRALVWVQANSDHRKTAKGMPRFLVRWLSKAADSRGNFASARLDRGAQMKADGLEVLQERAARRAGVHVPKELL